MTVIYLDADLTVTEPSNVHQETRPTDACELLTQ